MHKFSTPMMKQYLEIKKAYPDCLLFFRLGDFYELFLEDAKIGAKILEITLTSRDKGTDGRIPMAGVPYHAVDLYLGKLVKAGYKVAICEQVSEPNGRGIVEREVVRIVTPGTVLDERNLQQNENNYIVSLSFDKNRLGIAACDLSTGDFQTTQIDLPKRHRANGKNMEPHGQSPWFLIPRPVGANIPYQKTNSSTGRTRGLLGTGINGLGKFTQILNDELTRFNPTECILPEHLYNQPEILKILKNHPRLNIYCFYDWDVFTRQSEELLKNHFQVQTLSGFGLKDKPQALKACASLLGYLKQTQKDRLGHLQRISTYHSSNHLILDRSTIINLELLDTLWEGEKKGSLIQVLDQTLTPMGGRLLRSWLLKPLTNPKDIQNRLDTVEEFLQKPQIKETIRENLKNVLDIERILSRLSANLANARDLVGLKNSLQTCLKIKNHLHLLSTRLTKAISENLELELKTVIELIETHILDDPPLDLKKGGIIKTGLSPQLDQLRETIGGGKQWIAQLEKKERQRTSINSLKVKYNKVFGYYIEVSKPNLHLVPSDYLRKQTLVNAERFITPDLKNQEEIVLQAEEKINELEYQLFSALTHQVLQKIGLLQKAAQNIAILDGLVSFAHLAERENYCKPEISSSDETKIKNGRHPVIEKLLEDQPFVPNDVTLNATDHQLLLITGPNMAGKSVFTRQVALINLMAQMGSFVPAEKAQISIVDRIFVRSGASDMIASGLSTFMVEMVEAANILNHATQRSLVILDEVGRGTSTYDGVSIAWGMTEYLVSHPQVTPKTLFATHYHELQTLAQKYPQIKNYQMAVAEKDGEPIFLYKVVPGGASHSYGIAVAQMAGVPRAVVSRARKVLEKLEEQETKIPTGKIAILATEQMSFWEEL